MFPKPSYLRNLRKSILKLPFPVAVPHIRSSSTKPLGDMLNSGGNGSSETCQSTKIGGETVDQLKPTTRLVLSPTRFVSCAYCFIPAIVCVRICNCVSLGGQPVRPPPI